MRTEGCWSLAARLKVNGGVVADLEVPGSEDGSSFMAAGPGKGDSPGDYI